MYQLFYTGTIIMLKLRLTFYDLNNKNLYKENPFTEVNKA